MDYPLHQHYTDKHQENNRTSSNGYRPYQVFNERSTLLFDNNAEEENTRSPNMLQGLNDSWNQHQVHPAYDSSNVHHAQMLNLPQSERGIAGFVSKLYQCLQSVENNQKYARWCQHDGKDMFIIDCIPEFTEFVLPRLFKHCKFPSFVRQLNIYGFQRDTDARKSKVTKDKESCRWYHPCFRPGRRDLFHLIRRKATRYSRKKRAKASVEEEDPETILPLGSGDESELDNDNQNMILLVNNDQNDDQERRLSSASSVTQSMHPVDYTSSISQLQLGFHEPETSTTNSPNHIHHLPLLQDNTPNITDLTSDNADHTMTVMHHQHHHQQQQQQQQQHQHQEPLVHDQGLKSQLDHMERQYQRMQSNYQKQLNLAHIQINEQKVRIQQLETALGLTKHSVKQSTIQQPGGYMSTVCPTIPNSLNENYLHQNPSPRLVTNHRPIFEMQQKPPLNTPRPNYNNNGYYFHQQEIKQEEDTWFHHRNSLSTVIDSTNGMPTETTTITENIVKAERLKTTSPLTVTTNNNNNNNNNMNRHASINSDTTRNNNNNNNSNKLDLNGHMNFNNYMLDTYKNTHPTI